MSSKNDKGARAPSGTTSARASTSSIGKKKGVEDWHTVGNFCPYYRRKDVDPEKGLHEIKCLANKRKGGKCIHVDACQFDDCPLYIEERKREKGPSIYQVMQYPDWGLNGQIVNAIVLDKDVEGKRHIFTFKIYVDEAGGLREEPINARLFIPETRMTPSALMMDEKPLSEIFTLLRALMYKHLYFTDDIFYDLQTLGAMSTYYREVFDTYPYFDYFSAENGVGKTHAMLALIYASYHGFAMVIPTEAVLFRSVEDAHATVGIDEVHKLFKNPKLNQDILALLLAGHTKGIGTYRMDMNAKPPVLVPYDPFGLKAFTRKDHIPIDLLARSITIHMMSARKRKSIEEHLTHKEFAECRDLMYIHRLRHWKEVKEVYDALRSKKILADRQADLFLPLLTIAKLCSNELYEKVLSYAKQDETKRFAVKHDEKIVVLIELMKDQGYSGDVKVKDIRDELETRLIEAGLWKSDNKLTSQAVMRLLDSLGFDKSRKRTDGYAHYSIDDKRVSAWYEDITMERNADETKPSRPPQNTSLSSSNLIQDEKTTSFEHAENKGKMNFGEVNEVSGKGGVGVKVDQETLVKFFLKHHREIMNLARVNKPGVDFTAAVGRAVRVLGVDKERAAETLKHLIEEGTIPYSLPEADNDA